MKSDSFERLYVQAPADMSQQESDRIVNIIAETLSVSANEIKISCVPIDWESALSTITNSNSNRGKNET